MLASVSEQAGLSLTWSETPEDTFSHDEAHVYFEQYRNFMHSNTCLHPGSFVSADRSKAVGFRWVPIFVSSRILWFGN